METRFIAVFPGIFLHSIDSTKVLKSFQQAHGDKYSVEISSPENWKEQHFQFSFSKPFVTEAFVGYQRKGDVEYTRADSIRELFTQTHKGTLHHFGVLQMGISIPDEWDDFRRKVAEVEAGFQFYHVAKTLFMTLQQFERLELNEFKKFYTYVGTDGIEGLAKKFSSAIKENFAEQITHFHGSLESFEGSLGSTKFFPLTVLRKHRAFRELMEHRSIHVVRKQAFMERELDSLLRRIRHLDKCIEPPQNLVDEGLKLYQRFANSLDRLKDMFNSQLGISSTFFTLIALTITLFGFGSTLNPIILALWAILFGPILILELTLLLRYSTGAMIKQELETLLSEAKVYQI